MLVFILAKKYYRVCVKYRSLFVFPNITTHRFRRFDYRHKLFVFVLAAGVFHIPTELDVGSPESPWGISQSEKCPGVRMALHQADMSPCYWRGGRSRQTIQVLEYCEQGYFHFRNFHPSPHAIIFAPFWSLPDKVVFRESQYEIFRLIQS